MVKIFSENSQYSIKLKSSLFLGLFILLPFIHGCAGVNTFPTVARAGDTISVMIGGTERARKATTSVILTDSNGVDWDLQELGLVRSVFNLRADARSKGMNYTSYLSAYFPWSKGHEPLQTILVADIPIEVAFGYASLSVNHYRGDDSSGLFLPYTMSIEILPGLGNQDKFNRKDSLYGQLPVSFTSLEPAPHAKISFGINDGIVLGASSLVIDFDENVVNPGDINVYVPESTVRGNFSSSGDFGKTQRMVYWRQDGQQLFIDVVAPQGIKQDFLKLYLIHPSGLSGSPNFIITSGSKVYDVNGEEILLIPTLEYFP